MQSFGKVLAGICAVMFIVTGILALFMFNIERTAFSARTYKQAFEKQQIYQRMPSILASAVTARVVENPNSDPFLKTLTQSDWERTIVLLVPPEELKVLADNTLDSVFDYVNGKSDSATLSLLPFKTRLTGPAGVEAVKQFLQVQPPCTADQLLQLGMGLLQGNVGLCNPPEQLMGLVTPLIEAQLRVMVVNLPDTVTLVPDALSNTPNDPRIQLNRARTLMKLTVLLPSLSLIGLILFTARNWIDWLKWIGVPFIITGGMSALIALLSAPTLNLVLMGILKNRATFIPAIFLTTLQEAIGAVSQQILGPIVVEGGLLFVTGIAMLLIVAYLSTKDRPISLV
jgi:hypothetical protein